MLMTPMTPNVIARPIADQHQHRAEAQAEEQRLDARVEAARRVDAAHGVGRGAPDRRRRLSAKLPSAAGSSSAASRLRTSGLSRSTSVAIAASRAAAIGAVERGQRQAGLDLVPSPPASVSTPARWRSSSIVASSSERSISVTARQPHRGDRVRQREPRHAWSAGTAAGGCWCRSWSARRRRRAGRLRA